MKRIIKVLVVTLLMVALMATMVSPAFANGNGYPSEDAPHGWGVKYPKPLGYKCGQQDATGQEAKTVQRSDDC
jgi:hypothetical protein